MEIFYPPLSNHQSNSNSPQYLTKNYDDVREGVVTTKTSYIFGGDLFKKAKIYGEQIALHIFFVIYQYVILISRPTQKLTKNTTFR